MASLEKTIDIIFGAKDASVSKTLTAIESNINLFENRIGSISGPLSDITEKTLATEAAIVGLAAAYGGFAVSEAIKFQNAQIDLAKVLGDTDPAVEEFTDTVIQLSEKYGIAAADILQGIANFKQSGFAAQDAALLQKNALDLVIAGDVSAGESTEILISILKGFGAQAEDSARFIEALNNVSNEYATDLKQLATGMAAISPIANKMGFSFEETTGLLTPAIEVFRSGNIAAEALKTGLLKLIDDSKPVSEALASIGVSQKEANGQLRSGRDIMFDVAAAFQHVDQNQKLFLTSQLVGIEQSARMVTVFDDLAKVQAVTATAMAETGSATKEVELRLASAGKQVDIAVQVFKNLALAVGMELLPSFGEATGGITVLLQAFKQVVESGGLSPLFDVLDGQAKDFRDFIDGIAKALPDAFAGLDFNELIAAFGNLRGSIADLFGGLDLTQTADLQTALQRLVDFVTLLTNASAGAVHGIEPLINSIVAFLQKLSDSDASTQSFIGNIGGIATTVDKLLPLLGFFGDALGIVGGALGVIAGTKAIGALSQVSGILTNVPKGTVPLAFAIGSITFAITENTKAYDEYKARQEAISDTEEHTASTRALIAERLREIAKETGITVQSMEDLNKAMEDGSLVFDEATGKYRAAGDGIRDYDAEVVAASDSGFDFAEAVNAVARSLELTNNQSDKIVDSFITLEEAEAKVLETSSANVKQWIAYEDGLFRVHQQQVQAADSSDKLVDATQRTADATGKLSEQQKLAIQHASDLELKLLELASNERIKSFEFSANIQIADIEAQSRQVVAAFDSIGTVIEATQAASASIFGELQDIFGDFSLSTAQKSFLQKFAEKQQEQAQQALDDQSDLISAQIRQMDARTQLLLSGGGLITVNADNLAPELQLVMRAFLEQIQIQANADGLELLV